MEQKFQIGDVVRRVRCHRMEYKGMRVGDCDTVIGVNLLRYNGLTLRTFGTRHNPNNFVLVHRPGEEQENMNKKIEIVIKSNTIEDRVDALHGLLATMEYNEIKEAVEQLDTDRLKKLAQIVHGRIYTKF